MPPAHIFIARHAEQAEQADRGYRTTAPRPHDSPLTPNGVAMAETLGDYLVRHYHIDLASTVVLTSPLTRCVQTSNGIVNGALRAVGDGAQTVPIYLEPAFIESARWIHHHLSHNPSVVDPVSGAFRCPDPVYYGAPHHHAQTSPYVQLTNPFVLLSNSPQFAIEENKLVDHSFPERCDAAAVQLLSTPALDGKTVVIVAHAETAPRAMHAMMRTPFLDWHEGLTVSSFVHLTCEKTGEDSAAAVVVTAESEIFSTPHLAVS